MSQAWWLPGCAARRGGGERNPSGGAVLAIATLARSIIAAFGISLLVALAAALLTLDQWRSAEILMALAAGWSVLWLCFQPSRSPLLEWFVLIAAIVVGVGAWYLIEEWRIDRILAQNHGRLAPGRASVSRETCALASPNDKVLWLGQAPLVLTAFPVTIVKSQRDLDMLLIDVVDGLLSVTAAVASEDGRLIAKTTNLI